MAEAKAQAPANQSAGEALAVWGAGRRGVETMLEAMGPELCKIAAPNIQGSFEIWKTRALVEVSNRDELKNVIASREGVFSIYKCLAKAGTMGLQIGGQFPHAYIVPFQGKAALIVTAEGYAFAAAYGPGAVLTSSPKLEHVYEKDKFRVDVAKALVVHEFEPFGDRGKLVGYYMVLEYRDGHREIATVTHEKVEAIEKAYSNKSGPAWSKSPQEMHDSKAAKQLLKRPAKIAEGLAMLLSLDDYEAPEYAPPSPDIENRMESRLEGAARNVTPREEDEAPELEPPSAPEKGKPASAAEAEGEGGLF